MADKFEELKAKYQSVLSFIQQQQNTNLQNVNMEGDKLLIRAAAPSQDVKNKIWDQIKLVDPSFSDLTADIEAPEAAAAAAAGGASATATPRTVEAFYAIADQQGWLVSKGPGSTQARAGGAGRGTLRPG